MESSETFFSDMTCRASYYNGMDSLLGESLKQSYDPSNPDIFFKTIRFTNINGSLNASVKPLPPTHKHYKIVSDLYNFQAQEKLIFNCIESPELFESLMCHAKNQMTPEMNEFLCKQLYENVEPLTEPLLHLTIHKEFFDFEGTKISESLTQEFKRNAQATFTKIKIQKSLESGALSLKATVNKDENVECALLDLVLKTDLKKENYLLSISNSSQISEALKLGDRQNLEKMKLFAGIMPLEPEPLTPSPTHPKTTFELIKRKSAKFFPKRKEKQ